MTPDKNTMTDQELDQLLDLAPMPMVPNGAKARLIAKTKATAKIVAIKPRTKPNYWLAGLPLAASLAAGLYLGVSGLDQTVLPGLTEDTLVGALSEEVATGLDDAENFDEDSQS